MTEELDQSRNINTLLILSDLQKNIPGFKYSRFGRMALPSSYKEAVAYAEDIKHFYNLADNLRFTFAGAWYTTELFDMPPQFYERSPLSVAHAQLEITKNDLRHLLATVTLFSKDTPQLAAYENILENILFSLDSVRIDDPNKIRMVSMAAPLL